MSAPRSSDAHRLTKRALAEAGVTYREVNVRESSAALEYVTNELGYAEAPVCVVEDGVGEDHWSGFRPEQIARIAAAVKSAPAMVL